jgi:hypothetical protein
MTQKAGWSSAARSADGSAAISKRRLLAVASAGGHWQQLRCIVEHFGDWEICYVTTGSHFLPSEPGDGVMHVVTDANRHRPLACLAMAAQLAAILVRFHPDAVLSTGAAPGGVALVLGRCLGARTVWIDSMANARRMSLAGSLVRPFADLWLTQWPELSRPEGPEYAGAVL